MRNSFLFASFMSLTLTMFGQGGSIGNKQMQVGALEMPEYNILYQGYNNIIIGVGSGVDSYTLNGQSPTMVGGRPQFIVNPSLLGPMTLTLMGKTKDGQVKLASNTYVVKKMPRPTIESTSYSKSGGARIVLSSTDPINLPYSIVSVIVIEGEDFVYPGDMIPQNATNKNPGEFMGIIVTVMNGLSGMQSTINGSLKIME
jgi:hypothetical protein